MKPKINIQWGENLWYLNEAAIRDGNQVTGLYVPDKRIPLGDALLEMPNLEVLDLTDCELDQIPEEVRTLKKLRKLIFLGPDAFEEGVALTKLPKWLGELSNLTHLLLYGHDHLYEIPSSIGNLKKLEVLDLHSTAIRTLPETIGNCASLEELDLRWVLDLESVPESIGKLSKLKRLELMQSKIVDLPAPIENLQQLKKLNLNFNKYLEKIPDGIFKLTQLDELFMKECGLTAGDKLLLHETLKHTKLEL